MPYDIFISYASQDLATAEMLYQRLMAKHFKVYFDKKRLNPGFNWHSEIEQACENSRIILPILTPRWKESDWTKFETYGAEAIIPLVFEGDWAGVVTPPLERFQAEKLDFSLVERPNWDRLFSSIRSILTQPPPERSARLIHLHHRANDYFIGREKDLLRIHEELHCNPRAVLTQGRVRAIASMGGAGKTTLARHYAEKFWRCYPQIFWVDCRLGFEPEFAQIHDLLFPDSATLGYSDSDKAVRAFYELQKKDTRLLILDNADDEQTVTAWIPKTGGCHTLVTSRFAAWSAAIKAIYIYVLDKTPSLQFLQNRAGKEAKGAELSACETLADELGYLPLAMEQAAAYIAQQGEEFGFADYLRLYNRAKTKLLEDGVRGSTDYPEPIMKTWKSTMTKLMPSAHVVLSYGSFMAPTVLPLELLIAVTGRVREHAESIEQNPLETPLDPEMFIRAALNDLKRYSVAAFDGRSFSIHPLVQLVVRESLTPESRALWWKRAIGVLIPYACGHGFYTQLRDPWKLILPHAEALYAAWTQLQDVAPSTELAEILRDCYYSLGKYEESLPFAQLVYNEDIREFSEASPQALSSLGMLGSVYEKLKDFAAAAQAARCARKWASHLYGESHSVTMRHTHDLAHAVEKMGNTDEATTLYRIVLKNNPDDVVALGNYAYMLQNVLGDYQQSHALYQRALNLVPDDIINLNNFAGLCLVLGDFLTAEKSLRASWRIASLRKDRFAARTLFFRSALAFLRSENPQLFLGQLKTIFDSGISSAPSENISVMRHLRECLSKDEYALLEAVFNAINDRFALNQLKALTIWNETSLSALDEPWPENP
jgi:tetratricopeptide (TPR) repeat protein